MEKPLLLLVSISLLLVVPASAETKYHITGQVFTISSTGLSGTKVDVLYEGNVIKSVKTDGGGRYKMDVELLEGQAYSLRLSKSGYETKLQDFSAPSSDKNIVIDAIMNGLPVVDLNGPYEGSVNSVIQFSSEGSSDPEGEPMTFEWSFGDGEYSTAPNPSHLYSAPGDFQVTLAVTDQEGASATKETLCRIKNQPPIANVNGPYEGVVGSPVAFSSEGSYDPDGGKISYEWRFGDGGSSDEPNPSHIFTGKGDYTVTLTVVDENSAETKQSTKCTIVENIAPVAEANGPYTCQAGNSLTFDSSGSFDPDDGTLSYVWDFGDGVEATGPNPAHIYMTEGEYQVVLTVTSENGAKAYDATTCNVLPRDAVDPVSNANGPYHGEPGLEVQFESSGSYDPDGVIVTYLWVFGDGSTSTGAQPSHAYAEEGTYIVSLTVSDKDGDSYTDITECVITRTYAQPQSLSNFRYEGPSADGGGPYTGFSEAPIIFNSSGSYDVDGVIVSYKWTFGDSCESLEVNPSHIYTSPGTYTVHLFVIDDHGGSSTYTTHCLVMTQPSPKVVIIAPKTGKQGQEASFNSTLTGEPDGVTCGYLWGFGDGGQSTEKNSSHVYLSSGVFNVSLTVEDEYGFSDTAYTVIIIQGNELPKAELKGPLKGVTGEPLTFTADSSSDGDGDVVIYLIDFGDGTFSQLETGTHTYSSSGVYKVTLTVTDNDGGQDSASLNCTVTEAETPMVISEERYEAAVDEEINFNTLIYDPEGRVTQVHWDFGDGGTSMSRNPVHSFDKPGTYTVTVTLLNSNGELAKGKVEAVISGGQGAPFPLWTILTLIFIVSLYALNRRYMILEL